ncbi:MAG: PEGA domain-containing protein [Lentisphaeria bacterium]|nr:PEGA domain-containing protein [Lentisphaeria bacterium]
MKHILTYLLLGASLLWTSCTDQKPAKVEERIEIIVVTNVDKPLVKLDGKIQNGVKKSFSGNLSKGPHFLEIEYPGYEPYRLRISGDEISPMEIQVNLMPKTVPFLVETSPEGADVFVEGQRRGISPLLVNDMAAGQYKVEIRHSSEFAPVQFNIDTRKEEPVIVKQVMASLAGDLQINVPVAGVEIFLNGESRGTSEKDNDSILLQHLAEGKHSLLFKRKGFKDVSKKVNVIRQDKVIVDMPRQKVIPGSVIVETVPAGVNVMVDGQHKGKSPLSLKNVAPGKYQLKLQLNGYDTKIIPLTVLADSKKFINEKLTRNSGTINLITTPPGVKVYVNDQLLGVTQGENIQGRSITFSNHTLEAGKHSLRLEKKGYAPVRKSFFIKKAVVTNLGDFKLKKIWSPTHTVKTKGGTDVREVRIVSQTATAYEFEYIMQNKRKSRIIYRVNKDDIESLERIIIDEKAKE